VDGGKYSDLHYIFFTSGNCLNINTDLLFVVPGMRFGLLQVKVGLIFLLSNYEFSVCEKTQLPVKLDARKLIVSPPLSVWLRVN